MPSKIYNNGVAKIVHQKQHINPAGSNALIQHLEFCKGNSFDIQKAMKAIFNECAFSFNCARQMRANIEEDVLKLVKYVTGILMQ